MGKKAFAQIRNVGQEDRGQTLESQSKSSLHYLNVGLGQTSQPNDAMVTLTNDLVQRGQHMFLP